MDKIPVTESELINNIDLEKVEYVADIGLDKKYGLSFSGTVTIDGEKVRILGNVVLLEESGTPLKEDNTSFVAYPDGMTNEPVTLIKGNRAISAASHLCEKQGIIAFQKRENVKIADDAK